MTHTTFVGAWKKLLSFRHAKGLIVLPKLGPHIHRCTLFRSRMLHVVNNFCAFLMFEVRLHLLEKCVYLSYSLMALT